MGKHSRYQKLEQMLTVCVLADLALFIGYLFFAAGDILLGVIGCVVLLMAVAIYGLWVLVNTRELTRPRSLWLTYSFGAVMICTVVSLICQFP